jgi:hypothetical protein
MEATGIKMEEEDLPTCYLGQVIHSFYFCIWASKARNDEYIFT